MSDKDMSRLAVERASTTLLSVKNAIRSQIPYGPSKVRMAPAELRKALKGASPDALQQLMNYLGPEKAIQILMGAQSRSAPPTLEQFIAKQNE